jgi:RNA polymerase sigma-70 factor (ECF subfamily)
MGSREATVAIYVDDKELVAAHQAGDTEAFEELVREYRSALFAHGRRKLYCDESAEDAVQETLARAYRALPKFDGEYRLGPWLHRIMTNVCADEARRRIRDGEKLTKFASEPSARSHMPSAEDELGLQFDEGPLNSALESLPDPHREALVHRFVDELDYHEMAAVSGVSEENARARVSRAKSAMRVAMKGVAALPILLLGVLRRGEKAAAAAGSASAVATSTTSSATSAAIQSAPAALPTVAEATVAIGNAVPVAMPVIAKAAVGIGLAAAVLTPSSDSAVHQAFDAFSAETSIELLVVNDVASDGGQELGMSEVPVDSTGATKTEPVEVQADNDDGSGLPVQPLKAAAAVTALTVSSSDLDVASAGPERYSVAGNLVLSISSEMSVISIDSSSRLRVVSSEVEGRSRVDFLIVGESESGAQFELRLAGFVSAELTGPNQAAGLFRITEPSNELPKQGSFSGSFEFDAEGSLTSLVLNLQSD